MGLNFLMIKCNCCSALKTLIIFFSRFIIAFSFFTQPEESIHDPPCLKFTSWHLESKSWTESNLFLSLMLLNYFDILKKSDLKSSSTTTLTLSKLINVGLLLFACIMRSSSASFEEIKLIAIDNWIFHVSDSWRSIVISFK